LATFAPLGIFAHQKTMYVCICIPRNPRRDLILQRKLVLSAKSFHRK
jgi:hypothetical protein